MSGETDGPTLPRPDRLIDPAATARVSREVRSERARQDDRWGQQDHRHSLWLAILAEEFGEAARGINEAEFRGQRDVGLRTELIQVAAVAQAMVECGDRMGWWAAQAALRKEANDG